MSSTCRYAVTVAPETPVIAIFHDGINDDLTFTVSLSDRILCDGELLFRLQTGFNLSWMLEWGCIESIQNKSHHRMGSHLGLLMDTIGICVQTIKEELPDVAGIWLFGSLAASSDIAGSDIDLAVLPAKRADKVHLWQCAQRIASGIGKEVDLIDLLDASTVLRGQIMQTGQRIYCTDEFRCNLFETETLADCMRFAEERKEILEDIKSRGKVL